MASLRTELSRWEPAPGVLSPQGREERDLPPPRSPDRVRPPDQARSPDRVRSLLASYGDGLRRGRDEAGAARRLREFLASTKTPA